MLNILTIVLNGMPFIKHHHAELAKLSDWRWTIVEGASSNSRDTAWCARQNPQLTADGTTEYVRQLAKDDKRVQYVCSPLWNGKVVMVNTGLATFTHPGVLLQMDVDEHWTAEQLDALCETFRTRPTYNVAQFKCRYFIGPDILTTSDYGYGNRPSEWVRAWRWKPGLRFATHEPPVLSGATKEKLSRTATEQLGLVFDHCAWVLESQVAYKERFYQYPEATNKWKRLQANTEWPVQLNKFLPWVGPEATARRLTAGEPTVEKYLV